MRKYRLLATWALPLAMGLPVLAGTPARASGDFCEAEWTLGRGDPECQNVAALNPGNDTRVNLILLMSGRSGSALDVPAFEGKPTFTWYDLTSRLSPRPEKTEGRFASGEGSRCRSDETGTAAFIAAVKAASGLSTDEAKALAAAREGFEDCATGHVADAALQRVSGAAQSPAAKAFLAYLRGAGAFYDGRFSEATKEFESLRSSADPWIRETAVYMAARTRVNALQTGAFDAYGSFAGSDKIDKEEAKRAEADFDRYLKDYPNGRYAASARGLLRRVDWLAGWTSKLAARYAEALAQPAPAATLSLVDEIDAKLLPKLELGMTRDPMLLAVLDLKRMRKKAAAPLTREDLETQRDAFASAPSLFDMLLAAHDFYVEGDPSVVLKDIPDATGRRDGDKLWFSRQLLRGEALEATGDRNTRGFWKELYPGAARPIDRATVELALALHEEKQGKLANVFASGSLVSDPAMRIILLTHDAGPNLLRAQARDPSTSATMREVALFYLLAKELMHERYADFLSDVEMVPADAPAEGGRYLDLSTVRGRAPLGMFVRGNAAGEIDCPALSTTVSRLVQNPTSARDRLCVAEFLRLNDLSDNPLAVPGSGGALGSGPAQTFPGVLSTRDTRYRAIIADKGAPAADRAYALYRAVKCFEPTGNNGCGPNDVAKSERKAWYYALKRDYPSSRWAKDLHYWW